MTPDPQILEIPRGRAWAETWRMAEDDGTAIDLTGMSFAFEVRPSTEGEPAITGTATVADAAGGEVELSLSESQVGQLSGERACHWLLTATDPLGATQEARGTVWLLDDL